MLNLFIKPYQDELLYSIVSRYHLYSGGRSHNQTLQELFCSCKSLSIELPNNLEKLAVNIDIDYYSTEYFVINNTLFPLYSPFLTIEKREYLKNSMKTRGILPNTIVGLTKNKINAHSILRYCPMCYKEDIKRYGEAYFHRVHQIHGVMVCPDHICSLIDFDLFPINWTRLS